MDTNTTEPTPFKEPNNKWHKKAVRIMWTLTILGIASVVILFYTLSFSDLPSFEELENPRYHQASEIFAENGRVFGRYYTQNRVNVNYEDLSPLLVNALLATEDERFRKHSGIDFRGFLRAVTYLGKKGGASTITQQLAKQLFTGVRSNSFQEAVIQKLKEWIIAVRLERKYTKEEIITMYLNQFNFINGAYGIKAASEIYFAKTPNNLNQEEAATLVGMLKNPALYNPKRRLEETTKRREVVLKQMLKNNLLTEQAYDSLRVLPLDMTNFKRNTHTDGLAPYFRMVLGERIKHILAHEAAKRSDGKNYDIYRDGLKIFTTIDPTMQTYLEASVNKHMKKLQSTYNKHWKGKDEWKYREDETTDAEMRARERTLNRLIFESERAKDSRTKHLNSIIDSIEKEIDFTLRDRDIERMLREEKKKGELLKLVKSDMIGTKLAAKYRTVMKGNYWKSLKKQWKAYQNEVEKTFDEPVKMKVFSYENSQFEKDTTLTPLDSILYHSRFLQVGSMAVDPLSGYIKAWVGGINHKYFQFDHVTSDRQVGSTFKPFIYATAIDQQGFSPCHQVDDIPYTIHKGEGNFNLLDDWTPNNANGLYSGESYTLFRGLQRSKNTVSAFLMKEIGAVEPVLELAKGLGFPNNKIPPAPSICLGAADLSVMDMTGAYATFANDGLHNMPIFIKSIQDKDGRVIYKSIRQENRALHPKINYVMVQMLSRIVSAGLPGFNGLESQMGGKTGTTNDYVDGWFMGVTPSLVVGTWVGGDYRWIRFRSIAFGTGSKMARPVFANMMQSLEKGEKVDYDKKAQFKVPLGDLGIETNCELYQQNRTDNWEENPESFDDQFGDELPQDSTMIEEDPEEGFGGDLN